MTINRDSEDPRFGFRGQEKKKDARAKGRLAPPARKTKPLGTTGAMTQATPQPGPPPGETTPDGQIGSMLRDPVRPPAEGDGDGGEGA